jgi:biotin carboxyl carrier protein
MQLAIGAVTKAGKHAEGTIMHTETLNADSLTDLGQRLKDYGCQSLCLNDSNGILGPQKTTELLEQLKKTVDLPIALCFSSPCGLAETAYYAAASCGVVSLYCALLPITERESLPQTKTIATALAGTDWSTNLKTEALDEATRHFEPRSARGPRAYDIVVSGSLYHVTVRPSGVGAEIIPGAQAQSQSSLTVAKPTPPKVVAPTPIRKIKTRPVAPKPAEKQAMGGTINVRSTMEGTILDILVDVLVKEGDTVERGTKLLILEAMKMQNQILSPVSGTVAKTLVKVDQTVKDGQNLITLEI